jgi:hypothetical protein
LPLGRNFIGAVGDFSVSSSLSSNYGEVGGSVMYEIVVSGTGNFNLIGTPSLPAVEGVRVLTPEIRDNRIASQTTFRGSRTFSFPVLLTTSGDITFPAHDISWFCPRRSQYISHTLPAKTIDVALGDNPLVFIGGRAQSIRLGEDIEFIISNPSMSNFRFHHTTLWYWFALVLLVSSVIAHYIYLLHTERMSTDQIYRRNRRADAIIRKYMKEANKYAQQNSLKYYDSAYSGLTHFLTDKLNLPNGSVEKLVFEALKERGVDSELVSSLITVLNKLNYAKFSSASEESLNLQDDIVQINSLIMKLLPALNGGKK